MDRKRKRRLHIVISIVLLVAGAIAMAALTASKPRIDKIETTVPAPMVRVMKITRGPHAVTIRGEGTVRPQKEINLVPQVSGKIIRTSPALADGGAFTRGQELIAIDPADYDLAVTLARAQVEDAESSLTLLREEALVAGEEWRDHYQSGTDTAEEPPPLVAKKPQLDAAQARLDASRAELKRALLNRERTVLKAPFEGRVSKKFVDAGQYVTPGQTLATLFSTETVEIALPLEDEALFWFDIPGFTSGSAPGSEAVVHAEIAGHSLTFTGEVVRAEGTVDEKTRMARVIVRVDAPYATRPPLAVGLFVTVDIRGRTVSAAAVIPRAALRQGDIVWVVDDEGILRFRSVTVARSQGEEIVIETGLEDGEQVVFSSLRAPTNGMTVRAAVEGNKE